MQIWCASDTFYFFAGKKLFEVLAFETTAVIGTNGPWRFVFGTEKCLNFHKGPCVRVFTNLFGWPFAKTVYSY